MIRASVSLWLVLSAALPVSGATQDATSGRVRGEVLSEDTGMPLAGVRVLLRQVAPPQVERAIVTDRTGAFVFDGLEASLYLLDIVRDGYRLHSSERLPYQEGLPFGALSGRVQPSLGLTLAAPLEDGEQYDIRFRMTVGAVVAGRVYDSDRQGVEGARVELLVPSYYDEITGVRNGVENAPGVDPVLTDANGDYRFERVPAGAYYLRTQAGAGTMMRLDAYARPREVAVVDAMSRTWFPGVAELGSALTLDLLAGGEVRADITLVAPSPRTVTGRIENPIAFGESAATDLYLVSRAGGRTEIFGELPDYDDDPGVFGLRDVRPGSYELYVEFMPITGDGRIWTASFGQASLDVGSDDVRDLVVPIRPNTELAGEVRLDATAAERIDEVERLIPMLTLDPGMPRAMSLNPTIQRIRPVEPDGTFTIPDVPAVPYRVSVMQHTLPAGVYLSAARLNGRNVLGEAFIVDAASSGPLILDLRGDGGRFAGRVEAGDRGAANARVVLVPSGLWREEPTAYRTAMTDGGGRFAIEGIRPGAYTAFAFGEIPYGAWLDAAFMAPHLSRGETFSVAADQEVERALVLIQR